MDEVERLKSSGNQHFGAGEMDEAIEDYLEAIAKANALVQEGGSATESDDLRCALYSNLSWVYLKKGSYPSSWEAAEKAVEIRPKALKPWVRYVEARRLGGYPFDALVTQLLHVRPLVREEVTSRAMTSQEASTILSNTEQPLFSAMGLSNVSESLELVKYLSGVALVTRSPLKPNQVLFVEKRCPTPFKDQDIQEGSTTVDMVLRYAKQLRPLQTGNREEWKILKKELHGAWPRSLDEVSTDMMEAIAPTLRLDYPHLENKFFNELLQMALVCRFNGFQSGFFRTCALANHSCCANIAMKYRQSNQSVTMLTVRDIAPGDFLNVKYLRDAHFLMGVGKRREYLRSWLFWCDCERCQADVKAGSEVEEVACPRCGAYTLYPFTPNAALRDTELEKLCNEPCRACGATISAWNERNSFMINSFLTQITRSGSMSSMDELSRWMQEMLSDVKQIGVNPCHWVYRALLYFFCAPAAQLLPSILSRFGSENGKEIAASLFQSNGIRSIYLPLVAHYSKLNPSSSLFPNEVVQNLHEGSDILATYVLLWHHISPFYPVYELWAVHRAMCQLVLLQMLFMPFSSSEGHLSNEYAFQLLKRHAAYLNSDDTAELMRFFNLQKPYAVDPKSLPAVSKIKKLFR